jgi:hypothetical protein
MERKRRRAHILVACAGILAVCGVVAATASARPAPQTEPGDLLDPRTYAPDSHSLRDESSFDADRHPLLELRHRTSRLGS